MTRAGGGWTLTAAEDTTRHRFEDARNVSSTARSMFYRAYGLLVRYPGRYPKDHMGNFGPKTRRIL